MNEALHFLKQEMGKGANRAVRDAAPISLSKTEIGEYLKRFKSLDAGNKGFVSVNDLKNSLKVTQLHSLWAPSHLS